MPVISSACSASSADPELLNYARVIPTVDYAARIVSSLLGAENPPSNALIFRAKAPICA